MESHNSSAEPEASVGTFTWGIVSNLTLMSFSSQANRTAERLPSGGPKKANMKPQQLMDTGLPERANGERHEMTPWL